MLLVEEAVRRLVLADAGVSALIGTGLYYGSMEQRPSYPAVAFEVRKERSDYLLEARGPSGGVSGPARHEVVFYSEMKGKRDSSSPKLVAKQVSEAIRAAIDGYQGTVTDGASPESTLYIQGIFHDSTDSAYHDRTETHQFISVFEVVSDELRPQS